MIKHRAANLTYSESLTKFGKFPSMDTLPAVRAALKELYVLKRIDIAQGQKDFAACTKPRNFQFSATNRDFLRFPRQIAKFPILRDKSRFFQSSAKNRAFSFKSEDQICAFSFKSEDQICAFSFKSEDQVCVFSIKSAGQMSRFLQVLSK